MRRRATPMHPRTRIPAYAALASVLITCSPRTGRGPRSWDGRIPEAAFVELVSPPAGQVSSTASDLSAPQRRAAAVHTRADLPPVVAARIFAFADSQFHYQAGKRTFAQSPFAEQMSFEVAVRPAALDDGSDLLLALFLDVYRARYPDYTLVFLGDAADLSCIQEMDAFTGVLVDTGIHELLAVTSNHDGFYAGNFTSRRDVDGNLALTDMPHDWTRACSLPGSRADLRLTKGRAVARLHELLPDGPPWATSVNASHEQPTSYRDVYLYYVRPLKGGDPGAPPVYGVFLDTVDYRDFDFEASRGAGSAGAVSRAQLAFLDRAMFEAGVSARTRHQPISHVLFGHHPFRELEPRSQKRLRRFLEAHPTIVAYVSAHTHKSMERHIDLASGRRVPELIVGSTTDPPQSARVIEVRIDLRSERRSIDTRRLVLDVDRLCADIPPMASDTTGYTGYRILRDGTPELDLGLLEKLLFVTGLDNLAKKRAIQVIGALLMENELMRSWARLYRDAPIPLGQSDTKALDRILAARYAGADNVAGLRPFLNGQAPVGDALSDYERWNDPAIAGVVSVAERGVHRFANHRQLIDRLRAERTFDARTRRYFTCHAARAATAEARLPRTQGNVLYIR